MRRGLLFCVFLGVVAPLRAEADIAPMKFNEVREVAPGVFFRYSAISANDWHSLPVPAVVGIAINGSMARPAFPTPQ